MYDYFSLALPCSHGCICDAVYVQYTSSRTTHTLVYGNIVSLFTTSVKKNLDSGLKLSACLALLMLHR